MNLKKSEPDPKKKEKRAEEKKRKKKQERFSSHPSGLKPRVSHKLLFSSKQKQKQKETPRNKEPILPKLRQRAKLTEQPSTISTCTSHDLFFSTWMKFQVRGKVINLSIES